MNTMEKLEKKMQENDASIRKLVVELSGLRSLAHYDPGYSEAKVHNLGRDLQKLEEKQDQLKREYHDYLASAEYRKESGAQLAQLSALMTDLNATASELKQRLFDLRNAAPAKILNGQDPGALAREILNLQREQEELSISLVLTKMTFNLIKRPPQVDKPYEPTSVDNERYKKAPALTWY